QCEAEKRHCEIMKNKVYGHPNKNTDRKREQRGFGQCKEASQDIRDKIDPLIGAPCGRLFLRGPTETAFLHLQYAQGSRGVFTRPTTATIVFRSTLQEITKIFQRDRAIFHQACQRV